MIKFRAWDKRRKEMWKVATLHIEDEYADLFKTNIYEKQFENPWAKFEDLILMQSTGLKDKNGIEIFEGDVIGSQNKDRSNWYVSHHKIVWHDTGFVGEQICSSCFIGLEHCTRGEKGYVVIGNIYENPELLEVSE